MKITPLHLIRHLGWMPGKDPKLRSTRVVIEVHIDDIESSLEFSNQLELMPLSIGTEMEFERQLINVP